jgi:subtilase family serine protease
MKHLPTAPDVSRPLPPFDRPASPVGETKHVGLKAMITAFGLLVVAGCAASGSSSPVAPQGVRHAQNIAGALPATSPTPAPAELQTCDDGDKKDAGCHVQKNPKVPPSKTPVGGLTPAQLRSAYGLPAISSATPNGPTIAIVDAFEDKSAEPDLGVYRRQFGLPDCTTKNGCFTKVMMTGAKPPPPAPGTKLGSGVGTATWSDEIALDLVMASAACPSCKLLLVEAGGQDLDSLASGVNLAATYNPASIGVSWGVLEGGGNAPNIDPDAQAAFNHPGIAIAASTGDIAGQVQFPASSPFVTAVGGTTLTPDSSPRGWSESAWAQTSSGCSIMFPVPAWQSSASGCTAGRSVADVSVVADYNPGIAVYSTVEGGWVVLGGTSAGAPFVAGLYAAANDYGAATVGAAKLYASTAAFNPVDGASGTLGSPNGLGAF